MKHLLDQENTLKKFDPGRVYDSITLFPAQLINSWDEINLQTINKKISGVENICIAGMGGSALAGRVIESLSPAITNLPITVSANYRLPSWVGKKTLVIVSSYSGNTEETISSAKDAIKRSAEIFVITSGGRLLEMAIENKLNFYKINTRDNPSGKPRLALGSSLGVHLGLLLRLKLVNDSGLNISLVAETLEKITLHLEKSVPLKTNPAKILAQNAKGKAVIIFSANHLNGSAYVAKNQINESAKTFSDCFSLPELNHHLLEGLSLPKQLNQFSHFVLLNSDIYPERIKRRLVITKEVLQKQKYPVTVIKPESASMLGQALETIYFFEYLSFYLAMVNGVNPGPIPWVDYFKKKLINPI